MRKYVLSLIVAGFLVALALPLQLAHAELEDINETRTVRFSMSEERQQINVSQSESFFKNINISNWQALHDFALKFTNAEGVSNLTVFVNGNKCGSNKVGTITEGIYVCTQELTANLSNTLVNITIKNEGQTDSGQPNITMNILEGLFTIDTTATLNISGLTAEQNATLYDTNSKVSLIQSVLNSLDTFLRNAWGSITAEDIVGNITAHDADMTTEHGSLNTTCINCDTNATAVWEYIIYPAKSLNASEALRESWIARFMS